MKMKKCFSLILCALVLCALIPAHAQSLSTYTTGGETYSLPASWIPASRNSSNRAWYFALEKDSTEGGYLNVMKADVDAVEINDTNADRIFQKLSDELFDSDPELAIEEINSRRVGSAVGEMTLAGELTPAALLILQSGNELVYFIYANPDTAPEDMLTELHSVVGFAAFCGTDLSKLTPDELRALRARVDAALMEVEP